MTTNAVVELAAKDLNAQGGVFCPSPKADMKLWNSHPKVYLDVAKTGEAKCPYCGTAYRLKAGEVLRAVIDPVSTLKHLATSISTQVLFHFRAAPR